MENMEQDLQSQKTMTQQVNTSRTTRGIDNSSKYMGLLSKKSREEKVQNAEAVFEVYFYKVFN